MASGDSVKHHDFQGWVAVILALGLVIHGLALLTDLGTDNSTRLDSTLLATLFGGILTSLGQFLSGNRKQQQQQEENGTDQ